MEYTIAWVATVGILMTVFGAAVVFRYGQPFQAPGGGSALAVFEDTETHKRDMVRYARFAKIGLSLVIFGSIFQVSAVWLSVLT
jgi:hypothetical protein